VTKELDIRHYAQEQVFSSSYQEHLNHANTQPRKQPQYLRADIRDQLPQTTYG
jgi:hypothetical protein